MFPSWEELVQLSVSNGGGGGGERGSPDRGPEGERQWREPGPLFPQLIVFCFFPWRGSEMRRQPRQGPPGSPGNTIVFVMKIEIVYFLGLEKQTLQGHPLAPCLLESGLFAVLTVLESGGPAARVSRGPALGTGLRSRLRGTCGHPGGSPRPLSAPREAPRARSAQAPAQSPTQGDPRPPPGCEVHSCPAEGF